MLTLFFFGLKSKYSTKVEIKTSSVTARATTIDGLVGITVGSTATEDDDNIAYPLRIRGMDKKTIVDKVNEIAKDLNISECLTRKPKQISLGQAQRVAIARALIKNANFYFFDEPFSNLDQTNRDSGKILLLRTIQKYHASVIYVTHSINEATSIADKIFVMDSGKMIFSGTPEEVLACQISEVKKLIDANDQ